MHRINVRGSGREAAERVPCNCKKLSDVTPVSFIHDGERERNGLLRRKSDRIGVTGDLKRYDNQTFSSFHGAKE